MRPEALTVPFEGLEIGDSFESRGRTITEADVVAFAAYTGDQHPLHVDEQWARESPFGGRIAHGMLVVSYALGLVPFAPEHVIALRRVQDLVFKRPVRIGETICVRGRVVGKRPLDDDRGLVTLRADVGPRSGPACCRMQIEAVWQRSEAAAAREVKAVA